MIAALGKHIHVRQICLQIYKIHIQDFLKIIQLIKGGDSVTLNMMHSCPVADN